MYVPLLSELFESASWEWLYLGNRGRLGKRERQITVSEVGLQLPFRREGLPSSLKIILRCIDTFQSEETNKPDTMHHSSREK